MPVEGSLELRGQTLPVPNVSSTSPGREDQTSRTRNSGLLSPSGASQNFPSQPCDICALGLWAWSSGFQSCPWAAFLNSEQWIAEVMSASQCSCENQMNLGLGKPFMIRTHFTDVGIFFLRLSLFCSLRGASFEPGGAQLPQRVSWAAGGIVL